MKRRSHLLMAFSLLFAVATLYAQEPGRTGPVHSIDLPIINTTLKPGPGQDKASTLCNICHSVDYITMQPPFPRAQWTTTVTKMIKVMGAPINDQDAKTIVDYLSANYGTGS
jgi:hypothetical protein